MSTNCRHNTFLSIDESGGLLERAFSKFCSPSSIIINVRPVGWKSKSYICTICLDDCAKRFAIRTSLRNASLSNSPSPVCSVASDTTLIATGLSILIQKFQISK